MATKVILDVDTGTDDAVALMLAALHPDLELIAATTVNGNVPVDYCTENSLRVFDHIGIPVPVYEGVDRPIERDDFPIPRGDIQSSNAVHGGYLDIPPSTSSKQATGAIDFLIETYRAATEEIILVPVGPLSNVATALLKEPRLKDRIPALVIMGGANRYGNVTPRAEFNVWADPEAARVVINSGIRKITLVPLDATHQALVSLDDCAALRALGTPAANAAATFTERRIQGYDTHPADEAAARRPGARRPGRRLDRRSQRGHHAPPSRGRRDALASSRSVRRSSTRTSGVDESRTSMSHSMPTSVGSSPSCSRRSLGRPERAPARPGPSDRVGPLDTGPILR